MQSPDFLPYVVILSDDSFPKRKEQRFETKVPRHARASHVLLYFQSTDGNRSTLAFPVKHD